MIDPSALAAIRFGFGLPHRDGPAAEAGAMLASLSGADPGKALWSGPGMAEVLSEAEALRAARREARASAAPEAVTEFKRQSAQIMTQEEGYLRRAIARAIDSPDAFRERLVWFWQDHFTTTARSRDQFAISASRIDHAIRPHVGGRFADMLQAAILHPSMLLFLDQAVSVGPSSPAAAGKAVGLNENLARELLELHTLGVAARYSQTDVRELAELLTGLVLPDGQGVAFRPRRAEPGAEQVLGQSYDGPGMGPILKVLEDLAHHPETALHLSRKLAVHFLRDGPDEALIARMAEAYLQADTALLPVYAVLLEGAATDGEMQKVRLPLEFIVCGLRALRIPGAAVMALDHGRFRGQIRLPLVAMGQNWERAKGPDGWPEQVESWITPQRMAARINWAMQAPSVLLARSGGRGAKKLPARLPDPRQVLEQSLAPVAGPVLQQAVARAESPREGLGILFASPEFNRR